MMRMLNRKKNSPYGADNSSEIGAEVNTNSPDNGDVDYYGNMRNGDASGDDGFNGELHGKFGFVRNSDNDDNNGVKNVIGREELRFALQTLEKYKRGKASIEASAISAQEWWRLNNISEEASKGDNQNGKRCSKWLFNSIANKHADAMDNYPVPNVLPRSRDDEQSANTLSKLLPVIFEQAKFEKTYSDCWYDKLISGTAIYKIVWDNGKNKGLGDIDIRQSDILSLYWEPGIKDVQKSANIFDVELISNDVLVRDYPQLKGKLSGRNMTVSEYRKKDYTEDDDKSYVVDWYYKKNGVLHYCKFCNDIVLFATENEPGTYPKGWYEHGLYPYVFDCLFTVKNSPCGFGYVDVMRDTQTTIDELDNLILQNAKWTSKVRYFIRGDGSVNETEFADSNNALVHVNSSQLGEDSIRQIKTVPLSPIYMNYLTAKQDELKETSGNRDFSQGSTSGGVTSGSAIAALQEAGSKLSRDMIKAGYRANAEIAYQVIELIRQFYTEQREFRITGVDSASDYVTFDNSSMQARPTTNDFGVVIAAGGREPIYDIKIIPQKSSPFSREIQNQRASELYSGGFFNPQNAEPALSALEMMDFEGKDAVIERVRQGLTYYKQIEQLQMQVAQLSRLITGGGGDLTANNDSESNIPVKTVLNVGNSGSTFGSQADKSRVATREQTDVNKN